MKHPFAFVFTLFLSLQINAQNFEVMPGNNFVFTDVQFFKSFDKKYQTTLFSRTRARITYDDEKGVDFFSGAYLNYTTKSGIGGSVIGRINNIGFDLDVGIHFYKQKKNFSIFVLPSVSLTSRGVYSWFSIFRFRPQLNEYWKWYTSLELFSAFDKSTHVASTQRIRIGLDFKTFQFGLAMNVTKFGEKWKKVNDNYGVFLRKEF